MITSSQLKKALKMYFGFDTFKGDQEAIIKNLMAGHDTFVLMPTGGGKSLCYQLPALLMEGTAIIISPLIALMKNQVDAIKTYSEEDGIAHFINSSLNKASIEEVKRDVLSGKTKLLYVAPESLTKNEYVDFLQSVKISFYAVDEAHCISEWGHDFRPEYRRIRPIINQIAEAPVIALTATATDKVRTDIKRNLGMVHAKDFKSSFNRPNLYYEVRQKTSDVDKEVIKYIRQNKGKSGIIYCLSRKTVEELAEKLKVNHIRVAPYHAGLDPQTRSQTQDDFIMERIDVIVATIAFGMGIDKSDVRFVIHYDIPKSLEGYYQETGRAGRDGGEGKCIAFFIHKDLRKLEKFMADKGVAEQEVGRQLLRETANYCESSVCRRKLLLHYFGETYEPDNCCNCDNCLHPKHRVDAQRELSLLLRTVILVKENFKLEYLLDILRGNETESVSAHKHESLATFGEGADVEPTMWNAVANQAALAGYIVKDVESYGLIRISKQGKAFLKSPSPFMVSEDNEFDDDAELPASGHFGGGADQMLYAMLLDLRRSVAKKNNVPPYVIFFDNSLEAMSTLYPITLEDLQAIPGVGVGKAKRYGQPFIDLIKRHCDEYEIERPMDAPVKTVPNKSRLRVSLIQAIDRQVDLYEVAKMNRLDFTELLDELEAIVYSGTHINLDYFIDEEMDPEHVEDIYDYFLESEVDDIKMALEDLEDDYSEEQVRLVRIKFLSELGN